MATVQLDPPVGTCYFKSYSVSVKEDGEPYILNIDVTFYVYVTLAKPTDPNFTAKGGKVYIIVKYRGLKNNILLPQTVQFDFQDTSGLMTRPTTELPITGSGVKNEDTRTYTIAFGQTMSMYNNGGNSGFDFSAQYNRTFSLTGYIQSEDYSTLGSGWLVDVDESAKQLDGMVGINGLQVFETNRFGIAKYKISYAFSRRGTPYWHNAHEGTIDFSAETMAKAVVG